MTLDLARIAPLAASAPGQHRERLVGRDLRQFVRRAQYVVQPAPLVVRAVGTQLRLGSWWDLRYRKH